VAGLVLLNYYYNQITVFKVNGSCRFAAAGLFYSEVPKNRQRKHAAAAACRVKRPRFAAAGIYNRSAAVLLSICTLPAPGRFAGILSVVLMYRQKLKGCN
jgi:hypothetical protein